MLLSVIMPAYNEENTLQEIVKKVLAINLPKDWKMELIIVNDSSTDSTQEIASKLALDSRVRLVNNQKNLGKSQSVRNGILTSKGDFIVIQDADLEYDPNEILDLINKLEAENLDVVYGNRFGKKNKVIYLQNYIGNKALSTLSNLFTYPRLRVWIPDMEVCYKLIRGDVAREIAKTIESKSIFGFEPEVTAKLAKYKRNGERLKMGIVPISYYPRSIAEGKHMKAFQDGFKALKEILKFNLFSK